MNLFLLHQHSGIPQAVCGIAPFRETFRAFACHTPYSINLEMEMMHCCAVCCWTGATQTTGARAICFSGVRTSDSSLYNNALVYRLLPHLAVHTQPFPLSPAQTYPGQAIGNSANHCSCWRVYCPWCVSEVAFRIATHIFCPLLPSKSVQSFHGKS